MCNKLFSLILLLLFLIFFQSSPRCQTIGPTKLANISESESKDEQAQIIKNKPKQLPLFGSNLFIDSKNLEGTILVGGGVFPENYRLGPGDRLGIYLLGKTQKNFDVFVSVEGKIFIPTVGVLYVNNMMIGEFQKFMTEKLSQFYDNFSVNVMLIEPKRIPIIVVGEVEKPGKYFLSSLNTVLDAVAGAGGPSSRGSLRNIEVYRQNELNSIVDLYQFLLKGKTENDIFLQPEDKIVVPLIEAVVSIDGEVKRPARFELKNTGNERISDLIELAGNFTDLAFLNKIEISRFLPDGERRVQYINYQKILEDKYCSANLELQNDDQIRVFSILEQGYRKYVYIHGEVKRPGRYLFEKNMRVLDLLLKAGNLTRSAYLLKCEVAKIDPKTPTVFINIDLQKILSDSTSEENIFMEEDDRVFIRRIPEWEVGPTVELKGEVQFPGIYAITEDSTMLSEIIDKAGGFTKEARIREGSLVRKSSKITIDKEYLRL